MSTPGWGLAPTSQGAAAGGERGPGGLRGAEQPPGAGEHIQASRSYREASGGVVLLPVARLALRLGLVVQ